MGCACRAVKWTLPKDLIHRNPRAIKFTCVASSIRQDDASSALTVKSIVKEERIDLKEIDALAAASVPATATALGRKYSKRVINLATTGDHGEAWKIFCKLRSHNASLAYNVYHYVMLACLRVFEHSRAIQAHDALIEDGKQPNSTTTCALMSGLLRGPRKRARANIPQALQLWGFIRAQARANSMQLSPRVVHTGIHALCRAGRPSEALILIDELCKRGEPPGVQVYNMIIHGYGQQGDVTSSLSVLETMALRHVTPNKHSYNALVRCLCKVGKVHKAHSILRMAAVRGLKVDEWSWSAIIQAHLDKGSLEKTRTAMREMAFYGVKPGPVILCQLLRSCALEPSQAEAKASAKRVWKRLVSLKAPLTVECYNAMMAIMLPGDPYYVSHAMCAVDEMQKAGLPMRTDTFNTIMQAAVKNEDFVQAVALFAQLMAQGLQPDAVTYTTLMKAHQQSGAFDAAESVFNAAQLVGQANIAASNAYVDILARSGRLGEARGVLRQLVTRVGIWKADIAVLLPGFGALVSGYSRQRLCKDAVATVRYYNELGGVPDKRMMDTVLTACLTGGEVALAKQIVRAMQLSGMEVDVDRYRQVADWALIRGSASRKMIALERFKFWLGLPNQYYNGSD